MFQTSWNIRSCSDEIPPLLDVWEPGNQAQCYLNIFKKSVSCSSSDWSNYGSGDGAQYQQMSKICPPFHAEVTMVGLRKLRQHWGPINRYEVELKNSADEMFKAVQDYVDSWEEAPIPPEPPAQVATVSIVTTGNVRITVNGQVIEDIA